MRTGLTLLVTCLVAASASMLGGFVALVILVLVVANT